MNIALVLWDECHSRLSLFPILGDGAKHLACWCKPLRAKKQPSIFCPSSSFKHVAFTKWNLYDFPDIQNFLNDVNSAWINIHWKKASTNLLLFSVGEKGFQVRRKHFSSDIFSVLFGNSYYIVATKWVSQSDIATTIQQAMVARLFFGCRKDPCSMHNNKMQNPFNCRRNFKENIEGSF